MKATIGAFKADASKPDIDKLQVTRDAKIRQVRRNDAAVDEINPVTEFYRVCIGSCSRLATDGVVDRFSGGDGDEDGAMTVQRVAPFCTRRSRRKTESLHREYTSCCRSQGAM